MRLKPNLNKLWISAKIMIDGGILMGLALGRILNDLLFIIVSLVVLCYGIYLTRKINTYKSEDLIK